MTKSIKSFNEDYKNVFQTVKLFAGKNARLGEEMTDEVAKIYAHAFNLHVSGGKIPQNVYNKLGKLEEIRHTRVARNEGYKFVSNVRNTLIQLQVTLTAMELYADLQKDFNKNYAILPDTDYTKIMAQYNMNRYKKMFVEYGVNPGLLEQVKMNPYKDDSENNKSLKSATVMAKKYYHKIMCDYVDKVDKESTALNAKLIRKGITDAVNKSKSLEIDIDDVLTEYDRFEDMVAPKTYTYDKDHMLVPMEKPNGFFKGIIFKIQRYFNKGKAEAIMNVQNEYKGLVDKIKEENAKIETALKDNYEGTKAMDIKNVADMRLGLENDMLNHYDTELVNNINKELEAEEETKENARVSVKIEDAELDGEEYVVEPMVNENAPVASKTIAWEAMD